MKSAECVPSHEHTMWISFHLSFQNPPGFLASTVVVSVQVGKNQRNGENSKPAQWFKGEPSTNQFFVLHLNHDKEQPQKKKKKKKAYQSHCLSQELIFSPNVPVCVSVIISLPFSQTRTLKSSLKLSSPLHSDLFPNLIRAHLNYSLASALFHHFHGHQPSHTWTTKITSHVVTNFTLACGTQIQRSHHC